MLLTTQKCLARLSGIRSIPLWLIGGLFFYMFSSIEFSVATNNADITAQSTTDISNLESRIPRQNAISFLKQQLFTAKSYQASSKFNHFDDGKKLLSTGFSAFLIAYHGHISIQATHDKGFIKPVIFALQRAPPPSNSSLQYV